MRGAVRLTAGLIMLLLMLEPVMLLLNGGFEELVAAVGAVSNEAAGDGLTRLLPSQTGAEQAVRQGEAVWRAGWEPLLAAAYTRLDEQLVREIRDRFGEAAAVKTEFSADGALSGVKVRLLGLPTLERADESEIRRWLCDRLAVAESRVLVVREQSFQQETAGGQEMWPAKEVAPEREGAGIE